MARSHDQTRDIPLQRKAKNWIPKATPELCIMGRKSKATKTCVQNLSRKPTVEEVDNKEQPTHCNQVQVTVPTADLDLDDIIAQLGIETLPDLDEDEEDDEGLTTQKMMLTLWRSPNWKCLQQPWNKHRLSQLLLRGREKKETRDQSGMLETQPKPRGSMSRKQGNL